MPFGEVSQEAELLQARHQLARHVAGQHGLADADLLREHDLRDPQALLQPAELGWPWRAVGVGSPHACIYAHKNIARQRLRLPYTAGMALFR